MKTLTISKLEEGLVNEDAVKATQDWIAVSDGAGGGGVFADLWSKYLVEHIPAKPITDFASFDSWIDGIWEPFYDDCEEKAKAEGGMLLNKFYEEGSFATLIVVWNDGAWVSYGDSVAFCYNKVTGVLQHSFGKLVDFNNPPYLVNCKDPLQEHGFRQGRFDMSEDDIVFVASDALAHYIIMMYEVANKDKYAEEINVAIDAQTKDSNFIRTAMSLKRIDFDKDVVTRLLNCRHKGNLKQHLKGVMRKGLIAHDDYSIAFM